MLRQQGLKHIEISNKLDINIHTIQSWFYLSNKPRCISEAWKKTCKERARNLGEHAKRSQIYLKELTKPEQAYLLGTYMGDGNSYRGFELQVKDINFATYIAELISKVSKTQTKAEKYERKREWGIERGFRVRLSRYDLKDWLEKATENKEKIPALKTKREIWWFLSGFIDSEGSIKRNGNNKLNTNVRIEVSQKGDQILKQIKKVIERIDIHSRVSRDRSDYYKLYIYSKINFKRLLRRGNIRVLYKKDKLAFAVNNGNRGFIRRTRS